MTDDVILLTTDFSDESARAYAPTLELAARTGARVLLVNIVPNLVAIPHGSLLAPPQREPNLEARVEATRSRLTELSEELAGEVAVEPHVITAEIPEKALTAFAQECGARWIAMASHGRSGLRRIVLGSFAEAVLRHSQTPVLIYPPPA